MFPRDLRAVLDKIPYWKTTPKHIDEAALVRWNSRLDATKIGPGGRPRRESGAATTKKSSMNQDAKRRRRPSRRKSVSELKLIQDEPDPHEHDHTDRDELIRFVKGSPEILKNRRTWTHDAKYLIQNLRGQRVKALNDVLVKDLLGVEILNPPDLMRNSTEEDVPDDMKSFIVLCNAYGQNDIQWRCNDSNWALLRVFNEKNPRLSLRSGRGRNTDNTRGGQSRFRGTYPQGPTNKQPSQETSTREANPSEAPHVFPKSPVPSVNSVFSTDFTREPTDQHAFSWEYQVVPKGTDNGNLVPVNARQSTRPLEAGQSSNQTQPGIRSLNPTIQHSMNHDSNLARLAIANGSYLNQRSPYAGTTGSSHPYSSRALYDQHSAVGTPPPSAAPAGTSRHHIHPRAQPPHSTHAHYPGHPEPKNGSATARNISQCDPSSHNPICVTQAYR
ncbi:hypothetical protein BCR34DRAFT_636414 [Clohesyomyces aquaticus]|uniref:Uncharacterized protein n=1 Tax=Clohesyomyces aquaticus TaxID=1231657 RepID=A0A1Y2A3C9_9PLEO|nr:hypothetical protein BCR34DRAFT_636414 [Clohesyomyces aquaticus]